MLGLVALILSGVAMDGPSVYGPIFPNTNQDRSLLRILPASGTGAPAMNTDLCTAYASELTGNSMCLAGDGTSSGTLGLSASGSPGAGTPRICPNGPDCTAVTSKVMTANRYVATSSTVLASDFSVCVLARMTTAATSYLFGQGDATDQVAFYVASNAGGSPQAEVWAGGAATGMNGTTPMYGNGAVHLVCITYSRTGGAADNVLKLYINGTQEATSSIAKLINAPSSLAYFGASRADGNKMTGDLFFAMKTDKVLTPTTIAAMAATAFGTFTGTRGETITFTRASTKTCTASDGSFTVLPNNRACITSVSASSPAPSLLVEGANTSLALYSRDLSNAAWAKTTMTCAKTATGRDGVALSASTCTATGANATVLQTLAVAAATRTTSFSIKRSVGTGAVEITRDNGGTWTALSSSNCYDPGTFAATAINASTWVRCWLASSVLNPIIGLRLVTDTDAVLVDVAGDTDSAFATSEIITTTTSATRAVENVNYTPPAGYSVSTGCAGAWLYTNATATSTWRLIGASAASETPLTFNSLPTQIAAYDGTNLPFVAMTTAVGRTTKALSTWTGSTLTIADQATGAANNAGTFDGTMGTTGTQWLGSQGGTSNFINGYLSNIRLGASTTACDR